MKKSNKLREEKTRVLGIDPGYERVGVAIVEKSIKEKEVLIFSECIVTSRGDTHADRLRMLGERVASLIDTHKPTVLSIEKLYFNENQKTAFLVSEARGVILFIAAQKELSIREFTPLQIKTAITGYGRADKKQMKSMLGNLIKISHLIKHDDEHDAIAAALTSIATHTSP